MNFLKQYDNVQFVEYNQHKLNKHSLSQATMDKIPTQLENYFIRHEISPLSPVRVTEEDIVVLPEEEEIDLSFGFEEDDIVVSYPGV